MPRAILFDFGNVLGFFDHRRATRRFAEQAAMPEAEMLAAIYDEPLEHEFECGRMSGPAFLQQVKELIGYRGDLNQMQAAFVDIFTPNPPVLELIPRLAKNYRLVLASNTNELHSAKFRADYANTLQHFHALGMSWQAGVRKPERQFFEYCLRLADCSPGEAVFIDDVAANIAGAAVLGIPTIHYSTDIDLVAELQRNGIELS